MKTQRNQILLIQPFVEDFYLTSCRTMPIGLAYLAAAVQRKFNNLQISILDLVAEQKKTTIAFPKEFNYLKKYYNSLDKTPFSLFNQYYRFGLSKQNIIAELEKTKKLMLIGISSLFTPYYRETLKVAQICKEVYPHIPIVTGGSHATLFPDLFLKKKSKYHKDIFLFDYVLRGEAEDSFVELIEYLTGLRSIDKISNIVYHENLNFYPKSVKPADRQNSLIPVFNGLNLDNYKYQDKKMSFILTSRGCPYKCSFCSVHTVFGENYTVRTVSSIVEEIKIRFSQGIRHFDIEDDNFTHDRKHAVNLLKEVVKLSYPISFSAMNGICYFSLDDELIDLMKQCDFSFINLAIVSKDIEFCKSQSRPYHLNKFLEIMQTCKINKIEVMVSFIMGMPGQTLEAIIDTIIFLSDLKCLLQASPFYLIPGSMMYDRCKERTDVNLASQKKDPCFSARLTALDVETNEFSRDDIFTCLKLVRVINYIKHCLDYDNKQSPSFLKALNILKEQKWSVEEKQNVSFSPLVASIIKRKSIRITGYKTSNHINVL